MQRLHELQAEWRRAGRDLMLVGLNEHHALSAHPEAGRRRVRRRRYRRDGGGA
jgi:aryl carrier-like protein